MADPTTDMSERGSLEASWRAAINSCAAQQSCCKSIAHSEHTRTSSQSGATAYDILNIRNNTIRNNNWQDYACQCCITYSDMLLIKCRHASTKVASMSCCKPTTHKWSVLVCPAVGVQEWLSAHINATLTSNAGCAAAASLAGLYSMSIATPLTSSPGFKMVRQIFTAKSPRT